MKRLDFGGIRDGLALDDGEGELLYAMVRAIKPEVCLEIGTHNGYSTNYILNALKDNGKGHLWTTDPFEYGARDRVTFEDRAMVDFLSLKGCDVKLDQKIDFAFVDGFHNIEDVIPEIKNLLPQLSENAVVIFHDAQNEPNNLTEGVNGAIKKFNLKTTWIPSLYCLQIYQHNDILK